MRAILIDDEPLALRKLKLMLEREVEEIAVVGEYQNAEDAYAGIIQQRPDVVFLDICMPGLNGLSLALRLQEASPGTEIVFVTAYDHYAVKAFELYALDYVMKPVLKERLAQTVKRIKIRLGETSTTRSCHREAPVICVFNQLRFKRPGELPETVKWRTSKAQELFAYLLHYRKRTVDRSVLLELFWPDFDLERGSKQLYTTIYYIRRTLRSYGMNDVTIVSGNLETGYKLTLGETRVDVEDWVAALKRLGPLDDQSAAAYQHILLQFEGNYLGYYDYLWAENERERIRQLWLNYMGELSDYYISISNYQAAIELNQFMQQKLSEAEESYQALIRLYHLIGDWTSAEEQQLLLQKVMEGNV